MTFAWRRSLEKKSWSSQLGACFAFFLVLTSGCARLRPACAAPRAMAGLGYLPVVGVADLAQARFGHFAAERAGEGGPVRGAWREPQPAGRGVVGRGVGAERRRAAGGEPGEHPG